MITALKKVDADVNKKIKNKYGRDNTNQAKVPYFHCGSLKK